MRQIRKTVRLQNQAIQKLHRLCDRKCAPRAICTNDISAPRLSALRSARRAMNRWLPRNAKYPASKENPPAACPPGQQCPGPARDTGKSNRGNQSAAPPKPWISQGQECELAIFNSATINAVKAMVMQKNTSGDRHSRSGTTLALAAAVTAPDNQMSNTNHLRPVCPPTAKSGASLRGKAPATGSKKKREITKSTAPSRDNHTKKNPVTAKRNRFIAANRASFRSITSDSLIVTARDL